MEWQHPPQPVRLSTGEIHVWRFRLDLPDHRLARLFQLLDGGETDRARRFHMDIHRKRFIARRGLLRLVLADYLHLPPAELAFTTGEYGRPALNNAPDLSFNASHSGDLGLVAAAWRTSLGVDVERIRNEVDDIQIARRFFSPSEQEQLAALPPEQRSLGFFLGWTRKEAYIKSLGTGLSLSLDRFAVSLIPGEPARLLSAEDGLLGPAQCRLVNLDIGAGYAGALCLPVGEQLVRLWDCEPVASARF